MEEAQNELDDLWALSAIVPVVCYIMISTFVLYILNFDYELPGNEKAGIVMAFFTFSVVLACVYVQMLKKFRSCKNILKEKRFEEERPEEPNASCSADSIGEEKETDSSKSLVRSSSCEQRHSIPVQSQEDFSYRCDSATSAPDASTNGSLSLSKTDLKCAELKNPNGASSEDTDEIPVILHNCVKELGDIIEHVRLLNDVYFESIEDTASGKENSTTAVGSGDITDHAHVDTIEDTAVAMESSMTIVEERNSNSKFMDEEESIQCKLQSTDDFEKLTDVSENTRSIHPDMSQDLDNVQKPIKNGKIDSRNQIPKRFRFSKILSENLCSYIQNVSEDAIQEFQSKPGITVTDASESLLVKIPSHEHQLHPVKNPNPELDTDKQKITLRYYTPKPPVTQTVAPKVTVKRRIQKLPMRPYTGKITMSQFKHQRTNSMKRYETLISKREPTTSLPTMSKKTPVISVNKLIITMNESLITEVNKLSISTIINGPLISKFEKTDYERFAGALKKCTAYCVAHPALLKKYFQKPPQLRFPKWEKPYIFLVENPAEKNQGDRTHTSKTPKEIIFF